MKDIGHRPAGGTAVRVIERIVVAPVRRAAPPPLVVTFTYRPSATAAEDQVPVAAGGVSGPDPSS